MYEYDNENSVLSYYGEAKEKCEISNEDEEILKDNGDNILVTMCEPDYNLTNHNCPIWKKGKLIVRKNNVYDDEFLGCISYPKCTYTIDVDKFKKQMNK